MKCKLKSRIISTLTTNNFILWMLIWSDEFLIKLKDDVLLRNYYTAVINSIKSVKKGDKDYINK